jgi:membrane dipeptidase
MTIPIRVFDGHNDTLTKYIDLDPTGETFLSGNPACRLDPPRAKAGGFGGGLFAIFTDPPEGSAERDMNYGMTTTPQGYISSPRSAVEPDHCIATTDRVIAYLRRIEATSDGRVKVVTKYTELEQAWSKGVLAVFIHIEGAEAIREDLSNLREYADKGLRSIGITWSRPNVFGCGVPFGFPISPDQGPGLSVAGRELVKACNKLRIVVDLAHLNLKGFFDVANLSNAPLVVSHSNAHAVCASSRNLVDRQIDAVAASGGIIGVNFEPSFLRPDGKNEAPATLSMLADHIDYIVRRVGVECVGLGSDFDGAGTPEGLEDAVALPNLWTELGQRGYDRTAMEKIAHGNWFRVLKATLSDEGTH